MFELPEDPTNPLNLADWLEINALLAPDRNSSRGDLERGLRRAALSEMEDDDAIERMILDTFGELEERLKSADNAYPFDLDNQGVVTCKSDPHHFPEYVFCLCLSYFGSKEVRSNLNPRKLFEQISCFAAKMYLQGNVIGFGAPRQDMPTSFSEAVDKLCQLIGEGGGFGGRPTLNRKDDALDLVAWKDFNDRRSSKLLMFGQCASGKNWEEKVAELNPKAFWGHWVLGSFVSPEPLRSFFIPHRIDSEKWDFTARKAGLLFDRCRIAFWARQENADYSSHIAWVGHSLKQVLE